MSNKWHTNGVDVINLNDNKTNNTLRRPRLYCMHIAYREITISLSSRVTYKSVIDVRPTRCRFNERVVRKRRFVRSIFRGFSRFPNGVNSKTLWTPKRLVCNLNAARSCADDSWTTTWNRRPSKTAEWVFRVGQDNVILQLSKTL